MASPKTTDIDARWAPGQDLPFIAAHHESGVLTVRIPAKYLKADRDGSPLLLPGAVRLIDRLRAVYSSRVRVTSGLILNLREAMGLSQTQFGAKLGVAKMTVSRWECRGMTPGKAAVAAIEKLRRQVARAGLIVTGEPMSDRARRTA